MKYTTVINGETVTIEINQDDEITVNGDVHAIDFERIGDSNLYSLIIDNKSYEALVDERDGQWQVLLRGDLYVVDVADERAQRMSARSSSMVSDTGEVTVKAPMPGLVVSVPVKSGDEIEAGATVVILESMKMENELKAPRDGTIDRVLVGSGDSVEKNEVLVVIA